MTAAVRSILTPTAIIRLVLGWGAFAALLLAGSLLAPPVAGPLLVTALIAIVGVILICAFGVVHEAEHLARRLGDPYGSLVLTLSIVLIEVVLIAAVLLGPGEHATIARDSVMAVSMIILGAVIGLCLLVAGLRHGSLAHNRTGVSTYLSLIIVLAALAFALPALIGTNGSYQTWQEIPIIVLTIGIYAFFLYRQMGAQAADFHEVDPRLTKPAEVAPESASTTVATTQKQGIVAIISAHRAEIIVRLALLITTVTPIVLLSHDMASLLDDGLGRLGAPVALSGVVIALIVFLPETITSIRAAWQGEIQRVSNLCHGAQVSTVGLTIPTVLLIGLLTDQPIVLAESPANLLLFAVTLLLSVTTFAAKKVTAVHGAAHLVVFAIFGITLFS
ncbi:MAG: calcium:proton antiporter [Brevibacterium aurantiacum]|uniref:Ca2+/H+ antiporter n=1 Tax=Brevibacterium aurantiacum TaxID=273384 RepID=A0A1D7W714_BREAU|nr:MULTISPECIES: calcium:proton antiporter [Brevibacterium]MDN5550103.1 calcium:proton antiporter [Brevibacterium sp.]AOP54843.1 Ca2+/H+ antiporter [Brevibacterium aurantiacum]AZL06791.1 calcium:proton antiporter [Brevibacterium aurantiacum]AZT98338.1 calcium:proton antiporter [Brevibacterium aurantiacum]MDN5593832.1 calcium:proton antiporter [Brevibacterium sp.]